MADSVRIATARRYTLVSCSPPDREPMRWPSPFLRPWLLALAVLPLLLGCGRREQAEGPPDLEEEVDEADLGEEPASGEHATAVDVLLTDRGIEMAGALPPGPAIFRVKNGGKETHGFVLDGASGRVRLDDALEPGESANVGARLPEGLYVVYCPVEGHRSGLLQQIVVTERKQRR